MFSNQFCISGIPLAWIMLEELYEAILCFFPPHCLKQVSIYYSVDINKGILFPTYPLSFSIGP